MHPKQSAGRERRAPDRELAVYRLRASRAATAAISRHALAWSIAVFLSDLGTLQKHLRGVAAVERHHFPSEVPLALLCHPPSQGQRKRWRPSRSSGGWRPPEFACLGLVTADSADSCALGSATRSGILRSMTRNRHFYANVKDFTPDTTSPPTS